MFDKKWLGISRKRHLIATLCKPGRAGMMVVMAVLLLFFAGAAFGSSGSGEEHHGPKGWVATDTYRIINFSVLVGGLFFLLRKPVSQVLNNRIKGIKDELGGLETKKKEAEKTLSEYSERLSLLDQEAEKIIAGYIKQGEEAKTRIIEEVKSTVKKLEEQARRNVEHEFKQAKSKLQEEILEKAIAKSEEIIQSEITTEDHERLVDEYLKKVGA